MTDANKTALHTLRQLYNRPVPPPLWQDGGNFPWHETEFAIRMLDEHLDESHGAATRTAAERQLQLDWMWQRLNLTSGQHLYDMTCGPGLYAVPLAERGLHITGVDISPANIAYADALATDASVLQQCQFHEADIREFAPTAAQFHAAHLLYGQLAVMPKSQAQQVLAQTARALRPGGKLLLELLNPAKVDKSNSSWWFTDADGLWGRAPFLHLGERMWDETAQASVERYHVIDVATGRCTVYHLCDQSYQPKRMTQMLQAAGFAHVELVPAWGGLALYDADEWLVYIATRT